MTQMHGQALRSKKISTRLWCFLHQCIRPLIGLLALTILEIIARASSSHGETVGQCLSSRAEQCNRLASASRTSNCAVTPEEFRTAYPQLLAWIQKTLRDYGNNTQPVASMHFARLPLYFDRALLETAMFIAIDRVPMPPLSAIGLSRFAVFEQGNFDGVTYLDRYFIKRTVVGEEAIHFHELIHVIQWRLLGPEDFLAAYANGLDEFGYDNSPLEKMAYDAEALFRRSSPIFDAEKFVAEQLGRLR